MLPQDFHAYRALPRNDIGVIIGMHKGGSLLCCEFQSVRISLVVGIAVEQYSRSTRFNRLHLDLWSSDWHHDRGPTVESLRRQRNPLRVVAGRGCQHPTLELSRRELDHLVVSPAQFE